MTQRRSLLMALLISLLASSSILGLTYSALTMKTLRSTGTVASQPPPQPTVSLGIYSDSGCTIPVTSINWGTLYRGSSKTYTLYLRNEGNVGLILGINMTNINPPGMSGYLALSTNYDGRIVSPGQVLMLTLTLQVASDAQETSFSFDIAISFG